MAIRVKIVECVSEDEAASMDREPVSEVVCMPWAEATDPISWLEAASSAAARMFRLARRLKPDMCAATFALRLADHTLSRIDAADLDDLDPTAKVCADNMPRALAHGESVRVVTDAETKGERE